MIEPKVGDSNGNGSPDWAVSVVVPTLNSSGTLEECLASIKEQSLREGAVELVVVDGGSGDNSVEIAQYFADQVEEYSPESDRARFFTAPYQRNLGASVARGRYIYYVDADMVLTPGLLQECVDLCESEGFGAVIVFERSFGSTFWAEVKEVERSCYRGNNLVEAPRFVKTDVWRKLGGLDTAIGGGGDDWDLHIRLQALEVPVGRSKGEVLHNEGELSLRRLARKRFLYAKELLHFMHRHGFGATARHYSPFSRGYAREVLARRVPPKYIAGLVIMRSVEYLAGAAGILYGLYLRRVSP